ncbi:MAG: type II secretion system protein [Caldimonas sp.]
MIAPCRRRIERGFTLIEILITLALVGVLALTSMPLFEVTARRQKEADLRESLRIIRGGLDAYKAAVDSGALPKVAGQSGYPPSLEVLTESLLRADAADRDGTGAASRIVILRRLPRDPFATDPQVPAAQTWNVRSYASRPDDPQPGDDVFDVASKSTGTALDGTPYASW